MKILLADNLTPFRSKISSEIKQLKADIELHETDNLHSLFSLVSKNKDYDLILLSFELLGTEWRHALKKLLGNVKKGVKIAFIADSEDRDIISYLLESGGFGYIPRHYAPEVFMCAFQLMAHGCQYIPPAFLKKSQEKTKSDECRLPDGKLLTNRQREVLNFLGEGLSNKQIAYKMDVSEATVKLHINALLRNLDVDNRTQAVVSAQRFGFI